MLKKCQTERRGKIRQKEQYIAAAAATTAAATAAVVLIVVVARDIHIYCATTVLAA